MLFSAQKELLRWKPKSWRCWNFYTLKGQGSSKKLDVCCAHSISSEWKEENKSLSVEPEDCRCGGDKVESAGSQCYHTHLLLLSHIYDVGNLNVLPNLNESVQIQALDLYSTGKLIKTGTRLTVKIKRTDNGLWLAFLNISPWHGIQTLCLC